MVSTPTRQAEVTPSVQAAAPEPPRRRTTTAARAVQVLFPVAAIAAWQLAAVVLANPSFPSPLAAAADLAQNLGNQRFRASVQDSLMILAVSFVLSAGIGLIVGSALGLSCYWSRAVGPLLYAFNSSPKVVIYPVFILVLGLGTSSRIAFATFHGIFIMTIVMMEAAGNLDEVYLKLARTYRLGHWRTVRHVIVPALLPHFITALRLCFGLVLIGLVVAELFSATSGLGHEIMRNVQAADISQIVGIVVLTFVIAVVPTSLIRAVELRVRRRYDVSA